MASASRLAPLAEAAITPPHEAGHEAAERGDALHLGSTPLHEAAERGEAAQLAFLLSLGARADAVDSDGQTALHVAVSHGHLQAVEVLTRQTPCREIGLPDVYRMTPIHMAAELEESGEDMVALLLARGGDEVMRRRSSMGSAGSPRRSSSIGLGSPRQPTTPSTPSPRAASPSFLFRSGGSEVSNASRTTCASDDSISFIALEHDNASVRRMIRRASKGLPTPLPGCFSSIDDSIDDSSSPTPRGASLQEVKLRRSNSATGAVDLEGDLEGCELTNELEDAVHAAVAAIVTNE
uniref:Ankyrin repeat protein n=1 Tax=Emiliania huxleyi TaxID=2903 RepID=A0A7S3VZ32_EMIHU